MTIAHTYKLIAYPKDITLADGAVVTLKPMARDDAAELLAFFMRVPAADRFNLKEDVQSPTVIQGWANNLDYYRALPLLAWAGDRVVADATLHCSRANSRQHVGEVRIVVDPEFGNSGLGTALLRELADIGNKAGLEKLYFEAATPDQDAAIRAATSIGFVQVGMLHNHLKDLSGHPRDLVLLEMPLGKWLEWWTF